MGDKLYVWGFSWLSLERDMGLIYAPVNISFTKLQFGGEHRGPLVPNIRGQDPIFIILWVLLAVAHIGMYRKFE